MRFCFARFDSRLLFSGGTALHRSSEAGHLEVCKLLVEYQADLNAKDNGSLDKEHMSILVRFGLAASAKTR